MCLHDVVYGEKQKIHLLRKGIRRGAEKILYTNLPPPRSLTTVEESDEDSDKKKVHENNVEKAAEFRFGTRGPVGDFSCVKQRQVCAGDGVRRRPEKGEKFKLDINWRRQRGEEKGEPEKGDSAQSETFFSLQFLELRRPSEEWKKNV